MQVVALGLSFGAALAAAAIAIPPTGDHAIHTESPVVDEIAPAPETALPQLAVVTNPGASNVRKVRALGARFLVAPGESGRSGPGKLQTFRVEIESGIKGISPRQFAAEVEDRLLDHRSWGHTDGRSLQRVSTGHSDFRVTLTKSGTVDQMCYPLATRGFVSCYANGRAIINLQRWRDGAPDFSSLHRYRTYLINHEVGHALGKGHWFCPPGGGPGRVMLQQTYSMSDRCSPARFPRPDAPKFKSKCTIIGHSVPWRLYLEGRITTIARELPIRFITSGDEGTNVIDHTRTTSDGRFSVQFVPSAINPGTQSVSVHFAGNRDLTACRAQTPLIPKP